ncbi:hypothetical protein QN277_024014 [Acacia crassicarpa]|uniref:AB hydrolase-1 domain-containing protein n=1 Tax=Acacia crassicarpa TaxID=499986 RepID=A0AAE1K8W9_9FABA|nr:hypothetical protein QN277_024014 [Acacia crassicarpa]
MKSITRICFKLFRLPLSSLQFILRSMLALTLSVYRTAVRLLLRDWMLRLASPLVRLLISGFEFLLILNFRLSNLSSRKIWLNGGGTVMHFWVPTKLKPGQPTLILIHGFGGSSLWQFFIQVWHLSRRVNLYVPDLLFFGNSYSDKTDRSDDFQARCVVEGMKKLGENRFNVARISYGGYVTYKIAEMYPNEVEKIVIVSSGICYTEEQKNEHLEKLGKSPKDFLVPQNPQDLRHLLDLSMYRANWLKMLPGFFLQHAIDAVLKENGKQKKEILEYLINREPVPEHGNLSRETLIIWGDRDSVFPVKYAYELQRYLKPKAKVQVINGAGHALNFDAPIAMNKHIISFLQN